MYDPVILVHCIARFTMAASLVPYDRYTEGWTDTGSENEPLFKRKHPSLQRKESKESESKPRWTCARRSTPMRVSTYICRSTSVYSVPLTLTWGSFSLSNLSSLKTETVVGTSLAGRLKTSP